MTDQPGMSFHDVVSRKAAIFGDRPALVDATTSRVTTYARMFHHARLLATHLASLEVGRGDRVGVLAQNSPALVEVMLACARLGAIFVPLNTRLGTEEIVALMGDADARAFVIDGHHPDLLVSVLRYMPPAQRRIFLGDPADSGDSVPYAAVLESSTPHDAPVAAGENDPFIICYTGGSTGTPKGAVLSHRSVLANAMNTIVGWGLREDDVALIATPLYHTGGLNVLMTPLMVMGGCNVIVQDFVPDRIFEIVEEHQVTWVFMVPSMFRMMMKRSLWQEADLSTVRHFVTGGAPCPRDIYEAFEAKGKPFRMGYGLTEAGPNNFHLDPRTSLAKPGAVGKPLPFVEILIDDGMGQDAPSGQVGELLIRGPHLFKEYWWRPESTAEVLIDGWLRTGDLARKDEDGDVTIVGRMKEMFISGGENVYPTEVEEILLRHPAVEDAAVVGIPSDRWGEVGLAAVVLMPGRSSTEDHLRNFCRDRIARYKVPARVVFVDELPRTGAGKVDRLRIARM